MPPDRPSDRSAPRRRALTAIRGAITVVVVAAFTTACRFAAPPAARPSDPTTPDSAISPIPPDLASHLSPWDHSVRVAAVIDGDTIRVQVAPRRTESVRLIGLNAPETGEGSRAVQCFGREASERLSALIGDADVWLAGDPTQGERDRYDRLLAYAWLPDGTFLNEALIAEGYANEATFDRPYVLRDDFRAAASAARRADRGLWAPETCDGEYDAPAAR